MHKLRQIQDFEPIGRDSDLNAIFTGLVFCLKPELACELFDLTFQQEYKKRLAIMKKIKEDMHATYSNCHEDFIRNLMNGMKVLPSAKRQSCGATLTYFLDSLPRDTISNVILFFLESRWKSIRNRGYKYLLHNWHNMWSEQIKSNLFYWADEDAIRLVIDYFPKSFLVANWDFLAQSLDNTYLMNRLCIEVGSKNKEKLKDLQVMDEISHAYVMVKLGYTLGEQEAIQIFESNFGDERLGLLIWCFGRMGLWNVLHHVYNRLDVVRQTRCEHFHGKFGIQN